MHHFLGSTDAERRARVATASTSAFATAEVLAESEVARRLHRIVIVGGGAGGAHLAARLGRSLGRSGRAEIVLVDAALTHVWKPLLHEMAAGTVSDRAVESGFLEIAWRHGFRFHLGQLEGLDRARRQVWLAQLVDDDGREIAPRRSLAYDTLVICIGSIVNDFGTPGVLEHATRLDRPADAQRFHRRLLAACARAEIRNRPVEIAIVGGGATGVELAAELHESVRSIARFGAMLRRMPAPVRITVVEAAPRLLLGLPDAVAERARTDLEAKGIRVLLGQQVTAVAADHVTLADARELPADLVVWAAGIQGPRVLERLDGLEVNRRRQLVVTPYLQTTRDPAILAFGDCAFVQDVTAPPAAQTAQQQAEYLAGALPARLAGRAVEPFRYRRRGMLVSLGSKDAAGSLPGACGRRPVVFYGLFARWAYWLLQRKHLSTLHGFARAAFTLLGEWMASRGHPHVKLH